MSGGRTKPCSGMAVVRVLTWILFPRHPLMAVVRAASMPCARLIERNGCLFDRPWRGRSPSSGVWCYTTFLLRGTHERPPRSSTFCASTTLVTIRPPFLLNLYRTGESGRQRELLDWSGNGGAVECQGRHSFVAIPLNQTLCFKSRNYSHKRTRGHTSCTPQASPTSLPARCG